MGFSTTLTVDFTGTSYTTESLFDIFNSTPGEEELNVTFTQLSTGYTYIYDTLETVEFTVISSTSNTICSGEIVGKAVIAPVTPTQSITPTVTPSTTLSTTPTPPPTSSPTVSNITIELSTIQELGTYPEYTVIVDIDGFKLATRVVQQTSVSPVTDSFDLLVDGNTITGTGTVTVSRTAPDATVFDGTDITIGQLDGFTTSPTDKTFTIGQTLTNESFSVSGFNLGEDMTINITEG